MLTSPTLEKLKEMRLLGMAGALEDQLQTPEIASLGFEEDDVGYLSHISGFAGGYLLVCDIRNQWRN